MIDLLRIAWRNIGRNKRRSILSALAVAFAVVVLTFSMSLQQGSYAGMIYNTVHARTGNLQVQHPDYWPEQNISKTVKKPSVILDTLETIPHIRAFTPRVNAAALLSSSNRTFGAIVQGIDPEREKETSTLGDVISEGAYLDPQDESGALIGYLLARNLGVTIGDEIVFLGQGADGSMAAGRLIVRGLIRTGMTELDRTAMAAHIRTIQEAYSMRDTVSTVTVLLDHNKHQDTVQRDIESRLASAHAGDVVVLGWSTLLPGVEQSIKLDWYTGLIIYVLLVFVVGFGIANTFLMAFIERIHELGVLLALGMRPFRLSCMLYAESIFLTLLGIATGVALGIPIVWYFQARGIYFGEGSEAIMAQYGLDPVIHPQLSPIVLQWAIGIVLATALVLALYPARKAAHLKPVEALRHV